MIFLLRSFVGFAVFSSSPPGRVAADAPPSPGLVLPLTSGRDLRRRLGPASSPSFPAFRRRRRRRRRLDGATAPIFRGIDTHYVDVWVGTPPQRQSVIIDTGSKFTAFPCQGCRHCGKNYRGDRYFDPSLSSTYRELRCGQCVSFDCQKKTHQCLRDESEEGSRWVAREAADRFSFSPGGAAFPAFDLAFGCQRSASGHFRTPQADAVLGLAAGSAAPATEMFKQEKIPQPAFGICFGPPDRSGGEEVRAGAMTFGAVRVDHRESPMVYAADVRRGSQYAVRVEAVYFREGGGRKVRPERPRQKLHRINVDLKHLNEGSGLVLDSGTADTYLSTSLEEKFQAVFQKLVGQEWLEYVISMELTETQVDELPTIIFQLRAYDRDDKLLDPASTPTLAGAVDPAHPNDVLFALPAAHYLERDPDSNTYRMRVFFDAISGGTLGANAMLGHEILFDLEHKRLGFAESTCDYRTMATEPEPEPDHRESPEDDADCLLGPPEVTSPCRDSIDVSNTDRCYGPGVPSAEATGTETAVRVIRSPGTGHGLSCEAVGRRAYVRAIPPEGARPAAGDYVVDCKEGECFERKKCAVPCPELMVEEKNPGVLAAEEGHCDSPWGACRATCDQARVIAERHEDGDCYRIREETRTCHTDACARDACKVPFKVRLAMGLAGANATLWNVEEEEIFRTALSKSIAHERVGEGDIQVKVVGDWRRTKDGSESVLGMRITFDISIYTLNYNDLVKLNRCEDDSTFLDYAQTAKEIKKELNDPFFVKKFFQNVALLSSNLKEDTVPNHGILFSNIPSKGLSKMLHSRVVKADIGHPDKIMDEMSPSMAADEGNEGRWTHTSFAILLTFSIAFVVWRCSPIRQMTNRLFTSLPKHRYDPVNTVETSGLELSMDFKIKKNRMV